MMKYETLNQKQRDDIHAAMIETARKILAAYCGARGAQYADHDDYMIEHIWMAADDIADAIDHHRRHECAAGILADLRLPYDDGHVDALADLLAQHWDDAEDVMDRIRSHSLPRQYDWLYNARPVK